MSEEKARGYFMQTADISFPVWASHTPICTVNELKSDPDSEHFEYDGGGFLIENLDAPLFETVSGAVIKNVNIRNSAIVSTNTKITVFWSAQRITITISRRTRKYMRPAKR